MSNIEINGQRKEKIFPTYLEGKFIFEYAFVNKLLQEPKSFFSGAYPTHPLQFVNVCFIF